jgi:D-3-phosphoglycerate dehydrogenase/C-terminal binding protein
LHDHGWSHLAAPLVRRLRGTVFGVVGMGRIGLATARRAAGFGMRVMFFDPYAPSGAEQAVGFDRATSLGALMAEADILCLHVPLTEETRGMIGATAFAAAKPGLILVSTARGPIADLDALAEGLRAGRVGGATLDVLPTEPVDLHHSLIAAWRAGEPWSRGRLTLSPHAAFYSPDAEKDLRGKAVQTALAPLRGARAELCNVDRLVRAA